ncbi:MAG: DUF4347 domain-containing protein [Lentisphaerae bacterium]|nr:DUF4347 domain-containing protein [Lentisphaerota bacterium]
MKEFEFFKLEERVLFEAAAAVEIVAAADAADAASQGQNAEPDNHEPEAERDQKALNYTPADDNNATPELPAVEPEKLADVDAGLDALISGVTSGNTEVEAVENVVQNDVSDPRELVVVDSSLRDIETIQQQLRPNQDILILQQGNGLTELNEYLDETDGEYSAIHFVTHGDDGNIIINDKIIDQQSFNASEWSELKDHLTDSGDILFYGCNIAGTAEGEALIDQIAAACDADVAASTDTTGVSGNWDLEYTSGDVETASLTVDDYRYDLEEIVVNSLGELETALHDVAISGGEHVINIKSDITISYDIEVDIKNDLTLTIKGANDDIDLTGASDIIMFEFTDDADYDINICIEKLNFDGNGSADTAVSAAGVEVLTIKDSKVENFSDSAVIQEKYGDGEALVIENTKFLNNEKTQFSTSSGGAVVAYGVSVSISGSYFYNNTSMHNGGALEIQIAPAVTISNTTFESNSAAVNGGAVNIILSDSGQLVIDNSTFYQNSTEKSGNGGEGGAIFVDHDGDNSQVAVTNSTFVANTAEGKGSAIYNYDGDVEIINTLLIGNKDDTSVLAHEEGGSVTLSYSLVTSKDGTSADSITTGTNAEVNSNFHVETVFGDNSYDNDTHTIAPDAFHKAAWSGTNTGTGVDQLGNNRNAINEATGLSGKYSIGAVTAAAGLNVTQGDYEVAYTGSEIVPKSHITLTYADGTVMSNTVTATLTPSPSPVVNAGVYSITPSNAVIDGIDPAANTEYRYTAGTLTVIAPPGYGDEQPGDYVVYCEGNYPGYFSTVPGMQADLTANAAGSTGNDNIYTMSYPELIKETMLTYTRLDGRYLFTGMGNNWLGHTVTVDGLKYHPFNIDEIVREISESTIKNSELTHASSLYSGKELFTENGDEEFVQLFRQRGDALSVHHEPVFMEAGFFESEKISPDHITHPDPASVSGGIISAENLPPVSEALCSKVENLKSDLEKLLDKLCQA